MVALHLDDKMLERIFYEDDERFLKLSEEDWIEDYKDRSTCAFIFEDTETGYKYQGWVGKQGSHFSFYTWDSEYMNDTHTLNPVEEVEVIVKKFKAVDNSRITKTIDLLEEI